MAFPTLRANVGFTNTAEPQLRAIGSMAYPLPLRHGNLTNARVSGTLQQATSNMAYSEPLLQGDVETISLAQGSGVLAQDCLPAFQVR